MECSVCDLRGAVQACSLCHAQICEVCGVNCRRCGKPVCPAHVYKTHSGKMLCLDCQELRKSKRAEYKALAERADAEQFDGPQRQIVNDSGLSEDEILVASVRKPPPPWKLSLYTAAVGAIAVLVVLIFPGLRQIPLPGVTLPTPYFLMVIPAVALVWGVMGLINEEYIEDRPRCLAGVAVAVVAAVLMIVAVATDPARRAADDAENAQMVRIKMNSQQLENWRNEKLERFRR